MKAVLALALVLSLPAFAAPKPNPVDQMLLNAIEQSQETLALHAIEIGANPRVTNDCGVPALFLAAERGETQVIQALAAKGISIHIPTSDGQTALMAAAAGDAPNVSGILDAVSFLLDHHAAINTRDKDGDTALHYAADTGHSEVVRLLLDRGASPNSANKEGKTALNAAVRRGDVAIAALLVEHGADVKTGTPLIDALNGKTDQPGMVRFLINHGADVNAGPKPFASADESPELRKIMGDVRETPLQVAVGGRLLESARLLIDAGADLKARGMFGMGLLQSALLGAMMTDDPALIAMLLDHGVGANDPDAMRGAVLAAASTGCPRILEMLLDRGGDVKTEIGGLNGQLAPMGLMLGHGGGPKAAGSAGTTLLMLVASQGARMLVQMAQFSHDEPPPPKDVLDRMRAEAKVRDALCIKELAAKGVDRNAKSDSGQTALAMAAIAENAAAVKALIEAGADVNAPDKKGMTPVMWAAESGQAESVNALLGAKADVNARAANGATALQLARDFGKTEAARLIEAAGGTVPPPVKPVITARTLFTVMELPIDEVTALNDRGDVGGFSWVPKADGNPHGTRRAVLWRSGRKIDLGPGAVLALLDDGRVVVNTQPLNMMNGTPLAPFYWKDGKRTPVPAALRLATVYSHNGDAAWSRAGRGYLHHAGKTFALELPKDTEADVSEANDRGEALGYLNPTMEFSKKATRNYTVKAPASLDEMDRTVLWRNGKIVARWQRKQFHPSDLNNHGVVIGANDNGKPSRPALWSNGRFTSLPILHGSDGAEIDALNDRGEAVGAAYSIKMDERYQLVSQAVLWRNGKAIDLNTVIPQGAGWQLNSANRINERGEIVATANRNGAEHTVLLRPIKRGKY